MQFIPQLHEWWAIPVYCAFMLIIFGLGTGVISVFFTYLWDKYFSKTKQAEGNSSER